MLQKVEYDDLDTKIYAENLNDIQDAIIGLEEGKSGADTIINDSNLKTSVSVISFTPSAGSPYSAYGGTYYYKIGYHVHLHVGLQGLTAETTHNIYTLPSGFRPATTIRAYGISGNLTDAALLTVNAAGLVSVRSPNAYAGIDIEFIAAN